MLPRHREGEPHLGLGRHLQEEGIFPVGSLVSWIQWKENQEKPLLPARSREVCWVVACGQRLPQVSDPSSLGVVQEGALAVAADRFEVASDLLLKRPCAVVSSQHARLGSFLFPWNSQATLARGASGQALRGQDKGYLLCTQRGRGTWHFTMESAKTV